MAKEAKLYAVNSNEATHYVKAFTKAQAKAWLNSQTTVREVGAVEAIEIEAAVIVDATGAE